MRPGYARSGLGAWAARVPLPFPVPPGDPEGWTCLLSELGPRAAFAVDAWGSPRIGDDLLRVLLAALGQSAPAGAPRPLLLALPVPARHAPLAELLRPALDGPYSHDVPRALATIGEARAIPWLEASLAMDGHHAAAVDALGELGGGRAAVARWDGSCDPERLRALVRLGALPESVPGGPLDPLVPVFPGLDPDAVRDALEALDGLDPAAIEALGLAIASRPELAEELADALPATAARVCDLPSWAGALTASAGAEEGLKGLIAAADGDDWRARMGAVIALGGLGPSASPAARAVVRTHLGDDDGDVRREAAIALNRFGEPTPVESWTERYAFPDRMGAHPWGAALSGGPVPVSLFGMLGRRDSAEIVARAALVLALAHPDLAAPTLDALAVDPGFEVPLPVRQAAAAGLLLTGAPPADRPEIHRLLLRDVGDQGATGPAQGVSEPALVAIAARDGDWQVRLAAIGVLARAGDPARHDGLFAALSEGDPDDDVRRRARELRAPRWRPTGVPHALAAIAVGARSEPGARARGVLELERDAPELVGELAGALLEHPDREVAVLAARVVGRTAGERASEWASRAVALLRAHDWIRREAAAALLGSLDPAALEASLREELIETLEGVAADDDDRDVQRMATWAAGRLENP